MVTPLLVAWELKVRVVPDAPAIERDDCTAAAAADEGLTRAEDEDDDTPAMTAATTSELLGPAVGEGCCSTMGTELELCVSAATDSCDDDGIHCCSVAEVADGDGGDGGCGEVVGGDSGGGLVVISG